MKLTSVILMFCCGSLVACSSPSGGTGDSGDPIKADCDEGNCTSSDGGVADLGQADGGGSSNPDASPGCREDVCGPPDGCLRCPSDAGANCTADSGTCSDTGQACVADSGTCPDGGNSGDAGTSCGNGVCDNGEKCSDCAADCGPCPGLTHAALLTRRSGFAENVTGAGMDADTNAAKHVWVTTTADSGPGSLRQALSQPDRWVRFDDSLGSDFTITLTSGSITPAANITLDGRGTRATLRSTHSGTVFAVRNDNQIFVNFEIVVAASGQNAQTDCFNINGGAGSPADNVWIHHVTMSGARDKRVGVPFGARVTLDGNHMFGNSGHGVLVGCQTCSRPDVSFTTMHHNHMHDLPDRYPRVSDGHHVHAYNNVSTNWAYYAMGAVRGAELLAENNWFTPGRDDTAIKASEGSNAKGLVKATGNVLNGGTEEQNTPNQVFQPSYTYTAETANQALRDRIINEAGWQPASYWEP